MRWRNSLPARVALITTGLLALVMAIMVAASYLTTALLLRDGVDRALLAALPSPEATATEILEEVRGGDKARREDEDELKKRLEKSRVRLLETSGVVRYGGQSLPLDEKLLRRAISKGPTFTSVVKEGREWEEREGPDWWQAITPQKGEWRVLYAVAGPESEPFVIQSAAPLGLVSEVLPQLILWLCLLGVGGILLAGLIAWRMAAQTYQPLKVITATADNISTQTPGLRLANLWADLTLQRLIRVLNAMIGRLQEAFETQGRFVGAAAHELRGPLAAMRTELEVTLRRERSPQEYRAALQGALVETGKLSQLAEHLLTLARFERGASLTMAKDVDLSALARQAAAEVQRTTGGSVAVQVPPVLLVEGEPISLERMLVNLLRNGVEAGGTLVKLTLEEVAGGSVLLAIEDDGKGIPSEAIPHLFEPFYRGDPARSREGGSGLGLAIVAAVLQAHRGRVEVISRLGAGSLFRVWLPKRALPQAEGPAL